MICLLHPVKKQGDTDSGKQKNDDSSHMSVLPNAGQDTGEDQDGLHASLKAIFADDVEVPLETIADCGKHLEYHEKSRLRVGIIIHTTQTCHPSLAALANPASSCKVTALAVIRPPPSFSMGNLKEAENHFLTPGSIMRQWMRSNNLGNHSESVAVYGGEEGTELIVQRTDVDAIFIIVPDEIHRKYALSALKAKKHVLLNDPVSTSLQSFNEQLEYARKYGKFVQSSTAFVHQYRVRQFMECVLREDLFGRVTSVDAHLSVCNKELPLVGVNLPPMPLGPNQGCIRRLGRYCVLFSILLFTRLGSHPTSAQVHDAKVDETTVLDGDEQDGKPDAKKRPSPEPISANCTVKYSDDRKMTFNVEYTNASATRQRVEVQAGSTMATMSDFVFPHPDGLATYRVYEDIPKSAETGGLKVMHGEAIDIAGGPKHDVVMWRNFAELCRTVDEVGLDDPDSPLAERVREHLEITLHTKTILNALVKSFEEGFIEVPLPKHQ